MQRYRSIEVIRLSPAQVAGAIVLLALDMRKLRQVGSATVMLERWRCVELFLGLVLYILYGYRWALSDFPLRYSPRTMSRGALQDKHDGCHYLPCCQSDWLLGGHVFYSMIISIIGATKRKHLGKHFGCSRLRNVILNGAAISFFFPVFDCCIPYFSRKEESDRRHARAHTVDLQCYENSETVDSCHFGVPIAWRNIAMWITVKSSRSSTLFWRYETLRWAAIYYADSAS